MSEDLPDWLRDPALRPLWQAARDRLERNGVEPRGVVRVAGLDRTARHAVSGLIGRPVVDDHARVDLSALDTVLRERSRAGGLVAVMECLGGPVRNRSAERSTLANEREQPYTAARQWLRTHPQVGALAWVEDWLAGVRRSGLMSRVSSQTDPASVLVQALELATALTAGGERPATSRTQLAAQATGDAHALDDGRTLAALVLRALAAAAGGPAPASASERRLLWETFGVSPDSVSSTCLTLGLRPAGTDELARRLGLAAEGAAPVHLTGWDLARSGLDLPVGTWVLVCENPRVLEAVAETRGGDVAVVCTSGNPGLVTLDVLGRLGSAGARLAYHGDFDWPGVGIANRLVAEVGCRPWLMSAGDYLRGVRDGGPALQGAPATPAWDGALGQAMRSRGVAVHEEAVLEPLLTVLPS